MSILIANFSDSDKVPQFVGETVFGAGPINIRSIPITMLVVGLKHASSGTITANADVLEVSSKDDADTYCGAGSEAARMLYAAIDEASGYRLMVACPTAPSGVQATATITITGTASSNGTLRYIIDGATIDVAVASGDVQATVAAAVVTAFGRFPRISVTATAASNVVTVTKKNVGIRGNITVIYQDLASVTVPGTTVSALTGGTAVTSSTLVTGVYFTGGTGTETLTTTLANIYPARYNRIAIAQNDATSLAAWATQINDKASALQGRMEHCVVGHNGTLSAATSIAQTTLNNPRFQVCWMLESETHPSEIAAAMCAVRAAAEGSNPNSAYDGYKFKTLKGHRFPSQRPSRTNNQSALDNSVTPFTTNDNGIVECVRAITTHSLNGTTPDYRTIDVSDSVVPDFVRDDLNVFWTTDFKVANPFVRPDPGETEIIPPKVATPARWTSAVRKRMLEHEANLFVTQSQVDGNLPQSEYNYAANRIMSIVPVVPLPHQHSIGVSVRQRNVSAA